MVPKAGSESPQGAQRQPSRRVFPSGVLCCPRVAEGVNAASWRQFRGPGARRGVEGVGLGRRQADPPALGTALLSSLTHPSPATPARSYSPARGGLCPGPFWPLTRQHLLTLWASGPVTPPPCNPDPASSLPPPHSAVHLHPCHRPHHILVIWRPCVPPANSCQPQCLAYSRRSIMAFEPTCSPRLRGSCD